MLPLPCSRIRLRLVRLLLALILTFGSISGAHFNPAVTLADALENGIPWSEAAFYVVAQCIGGISGTVVAHLMFGLPWYSLSRTPDTGRPWSSANSSRPSDCLCVIWGCSRLRSNATPFAVASYITAAYWFTASTSFANPAVTIARSLSDTFAGIRTCGRSVFCHCATGRSLLRNLAVSLAGSSLACLCWPSGHASR